MPSELVTLIEELRTAISAPECDERFIIARLTIIKLKAEEASDASGKSQAEIAILESQLHEKTRQLQAARSHFKQEKEGAKSPAR